MSALLVVHSHLHRRFSGATRHVESILGELAKHVEARGFGTFPHTARPISLIDWKELTRRAAQEPVIWHAHRVNELLVGLFLKARFRNVRVVWTRHAVGKPSFFTRLLLRFTDRMVAVSPEAAADLGSSCVVIGHGVSLEQFSEPKNRSTAFEALQLGGRFGIGVFGRVRPDKGQQDFAQAVKPLLSEQPDWRVALVGRVKPSEQAWASQLQLPLIGEVTSVERWYQGLTVVVSPSYEESFGLTRAEALAAGCCLVTTRLNALDRLLEHGKTGFLYEKGDVAALNQILARLMKDPALAARVGAAGAELARRELGIDREATALLKVYRDCLQ